MRRSNRIIILAATDRLSYNLYANLLLAVNTYLLFEVIHDSKQGILPAAHVVINNSDMFLIPLKIIYFSYIRIKFYSSITKILYYINCWCIIIWNKIKHILLRWHKRRNYEILIYFIAFICSHYRTTDDWLVKCTWN